MDAAFCPHMSHQALCARKRTLCTMITMDRIVRIDAYLYPVLPPETSVSAYLRDLDHWAAGLPKWLGLRMTDGLLRMRAMDTVLFNDHLNALLLRYGMHVTPIDDPDSEIAMGYSAEGLFDATEQAQVLRDRVAIAARATWSADPGPVHRYVHGVLHEADALQGVAA